MVTLKDIAKEVGVSANTVSCALRGKGFIGHDRRREIIDLAFKMGYRPNSHARGIRYGRYNCLAMLHDNQNHRSELNPWLLRGIIASAENRGQHFSMASFPDEWMSEGDFIPKMLKELFADGVLINYHNNLPENMEHLIREYRTPFVFLNRKSDINSIYPDEYGGMKLLVENFIAQGHKKIMYIDLSYRHFKTPQRHFSRVDRMQAYLDTMNAAGMKPILLTDEGKDPLISRQTKQWIPRVIGKGGPSAVIFQSFEYANTCLNILEYEGIKVPDAITLASFNRVAFADGFGCIDVIEQPWAEIAEQAVEMLMAKIADPGKDICSKIVKCRFLKAQK